MDKYFSLLNSHIFSLLSKEETLITNIEGENSQFIRFNNSKVRQTGLIDDMSFSMILIYNNRKTSISMTLTGMKEKDKLIISSYLEKLRNNISYMPEDPFIVMPKLSDSSKEVYSGALLDNKKSVDNLLPVMQGVDLTGIWASGRIFSGNANSLGLEHWFETETYGLDYSLITPSKKMVKACYAGTKWNQDEYENFIVGSKKKLELMYKDPVKIDPGDYRTYIAPDGVSDLLSMLSWGGISEASIQQGDSSLIKLKNLESKLSPCFTLSEDFSNGMVPRFNGMGEVAPEKLPLIVAGTLKNTLVNSRTEKEYNVPTNYASRDEGLRAPIMTVGDLVCDPQVLEEFFFRSLVQMHRAHPRPMTRDRSPGYKRNLYLENPRFREHERELQPNRSRANSHEWPCRLESGNRYRTLVTSPTSPRPLGKRRGRGYRGFR